MVREIIIQLQMELNVWSEICEYKYLNDYTSFYK